MKKTHYSPDLTVGEALKQYFANTGFDQSSYQDETFKMTLLGRVVTLPNPWARRQAIKIHDLNHIVTGYDTDFYSESLIGAYELGSGIPFEYRAAWFFNCNSTFIGLLHSPIETTKAFLAGRSNEANLYELVAIGNEKDYETVLQYKVGTLVQYINQKPTKKLEWDDVVDLLAYAVVGLAIVPIITLGLAIGMLCSKPSPEK